MSRCQRQLWNNANDRNVYNIEIVVLETENRLFKKFLESHENIFAETASDLRILDFEICCQINKMSIL